MKILKIGAAIVLGAFVAGYVIAKTKKKSYPKQGTTRKW